MSPESTPLHSAPLLTRRGLLGGLLGLAGAGALEAARRKSYFFLPGCFDRFRRSEVGVFEPTGSSELVFDPDVLVGEWGKRFGMDFFGESSFKLEPLEPPPDSELVAYRGVRVPTLRNRASVDRFSLDLKLGDHIYVSGALGLPDGIKLTVASLRHNFHLERPLTTELELREL